MSAKKDEKKKGGKKDKDKDAEKEKMAEEEARRLEEKKQAEQRIVVLQKSGIIDAYEYFLRAICKNGLPEANIFEFAAQQILKYQKKMKLKQAKKDQLVKSPREQRQGSLEKIQKLEKSTKAITKPPQVLPFKGEAKQEVLKVLKK